MGGWSIASAAVLGAVLGKAFFTNDGWGALTGLVFVLPVIFIFQADKLLLLVWLLQAALLTYTLRTDLAKAPQFKPWLKRLFTIHGLRNMDPYFTHDLIIHFIFFQGILLLVVLSNLYLLRKARRGKATPKSLSFRSLFLPANEEANIARLVRSLLAQDYPDFEILALDDNSSDETGRILREIAETNPKLTVLSGAPENSSLTGKNWACAQLASQAAGELLFFTDADTFHQPNALRELVACMQARKRRLRYWFPEAGTWQPRGRLLVPFFSWAMLDFIALWLAYLCAGKPWRSASVR